MLTLVVHRPIGPACVEALGTGLTVFAMLPVVQRVFDLPVSENKA
jgi:hypothetical protein